MNIRPTHKTTALGTDITFKVYDFRGRNGFPQGQKGLVFEHLEQRTIRCQITGAPIKRDARYVIRTDESGLWRIDYLPRFGPAEAVYGLDLVAQWATNHEAAAALVGRLNEIRDNSTLGTF